ncbi:MAG: segregation/condensation protein A [Actinomycetota bacterium]|nr:segregation/condensation protein A [Actinomycetota bacterium]
MPYQVRTPVFEGPFDLLLHLIAREEVDLYDISLSTIVDAYLAELDRMAGALDLDRATGFLVIAATLVELKTRRLLPGPADADPEEELALFEERDLLLARLIECKTFREAGAALARMATVADRSWPRTTGPGERLLSLAPDLLAGVTAADVAAAWGRVIAPKPVPHVALDHVAPIRVSVRDALVELARSLPAVGRATFRQLTDGIDARLDVIVRFLAVLELYKQGLVELDQASTFGDLEVTWLSDDDATAELLATADSYD